MNNLSWDQLRSMRNTLAQDEFDQRKRTTAALSQRTPRYISRCRTCSLVTGNVADYTEQCERLGHVIMGI